MSQFTFALLAVFGLPAAILALLMMAYRLAPPAIWKTLPVQAAATLAFLSCIGLPVLIIHIDSQGDFFEDETALVSEAFGLPQAVSIDRQGDKSLRLGDCWRNAVNWRSDVIFADAASFNQWRAGQAFRQGIAAQVAAYFGRAPQEVEVAAGALDLAPLGPQYELSDARDSYQRNVAILEYREPFVCAAIDRDADGRIGLRRCDPLLEGGGGGNAGQVIIKPRAKERRIEGLIYYSTGPSTCTNPLRRAVNGALGLPHSGGGAPNTAIGGVLPVM